MKTAVRAELPRAVKPVVVRSIESIDLREFLARYARAIVEAHGPGPSSPTGPQLVQPTTVSTPGSRP